MRSQAAALAFDTTQLGLNRAPFTLKRVLGARRLTP